MVAAQSPGKVHMDSAECRSLGAVGIRKWPKFFRRIQSGRANQDSGIVSAQIMFGNSRGLQALNFKPNKINIVLK